MSTSSLQDLLGDLERRYPRSTAQEWDAVGLIAGDPQQPVRRVLCAVEATEATAREAVEIGADLLLVHHPLLLRGVTSIAETTAKGRILTTLVRAGVALYAAHTNADDAPGGVSASLAEAVGMVDVEPLVPATHPDAAAGAGTGRVGRLAEPVTLTAFARRVAEVLPATTQGIRVAGDGDALVERVAVCGGSGDSYLAVARDSGADVYLTADLRHHPATDFRAAGSGRSSWTPRTGRASGCGCHRSPISCGRTPRRGALRWRSTSPPRAPMPGPTSPCRNLCPSTPPEHPLEHPA
ncbi:Nif3-like dinuclear metal center hexameric protein [Litorihabitans aurantiacus]|uniref:GTP cyclohydrolase 1 type 2 homolog n=1 Tax=Litorihabitans aurantiacus TaxID=1930061 RepID=A0AA37XEB0_9MICO|nr:GTP cyclohydrolase 1 type 2 [Litorihabitans aurantiacus]